MGNKQSNWMNMNKVNAQLSRQTLDMLVDISCHQYYGNILVEIKDCPQEDVNVALRLLYENQQEIDTNIGENIYNITGMFTSRCITFRTNNEIKDYSTVSKFLEDSVNHEHICNYLGVKQINTNTSQQVVYNKRQIQYCSPKDTMTTCQKLYEAGLITYVRTDINTYGEDLHYVQKNTLLQIGVMHMY